MASVAASTAASALAEVRSQCERTVTEERKQATARLQDSDQQHAVSLAQADQNARRQLEAMQSAHSEAMAQARQEAAASQARLKHTAKWSQPGALTCAYCSSARMWSSNHVRDTMSRLDHPVQDDVKGTSAKPGLLPSHRHCGMRSSARKRRSRRLLLRTSTADTSQLSRRSSGMRLPR